MRRSRLWKIISLIQILIVVFIVSGLVHACTRPPRDPEEYEGVIVNDDWIYTLETIDYLDTKFEGVCIIAPSKKARLKETIIIPEYIDGKPVIQVGDKNDYSLSYHSVNTYFQTINTKKIIIPWRVAFLQDKESGRYTRKIIYDCFSTDSAIKPKIIFCNYYAREGGGKGIIHDDLFRDDAFYCYENGRGEDINRGNIVFYYNYEEAENGGLFWMDDLEIDELCGVPNIPERAGYEFVGWYTETEGINEWNFEEDTIAQDDVELYAKWR